MTDRIISQAFDTDVFLLVMTNEMNEASGIYEPMLAMGWIGQRPIDHELAWHPHTAIPAGWCEVVLTRRLPCGIEIRIEQRGFAIYNFAGWPPGVARPPGMPAIRTLGDVSKTAKPALIQRLRVINTHLTLLHAAAMFQHDESPSVTRTHERDLYRFDFPDEGGNGYWYRPIGETLPTEVVVADRSRMGAMPTSTFELSLDWLDDVVIKPALIEFDLLNQTQAALDTHDYSLAVVAGWTVCEMRLRALGLGIPGGEHEHVAKVIAALDQHGQLSGDIAQRLGELRKKRNKWLHEGNDPEEKVATDALLLATELLRVIVPNLTTRPTSSLLFL